MVYVGIDPGKNGGVSFVTKSGTQKSYPMPPLDLLSELLFQIHTDQTIDKCMVEHAQAMPKQGVVSMFNYGAHFGEIKGILTAFQIPFSLVKPKVWQKEMFKFTKSFSKNIKIKPKKKALAVVTKLFGKAGVESIFLKTKRCKKPHDGMIDAYLIAEFCRRSDR